MNISIFIVLLSLTVIHASDRPKKNVGPDRTDGPKAKKLRGNSQIVIESHWKEQRKKYEDAYTVDLTSARKAKITFLCALKKSKQFYVPEIPLIMNNILHFAGLLTLNPWTRQSLLKVLQTASKIPPSVNAPLLKFDVHPAVLRARIKSGAHSACHVVHEEFRKYTEMKKKANDWKTFLKLSSDEKNQIYREKAAEMGVALIHFTGFFHAPFKNRPAIRHRKFNPLVMASCRGYMEIITVLLAIGVDVNEVSEGDDQWVGERTALIEAARSESQIRSIEVINVLLENGADVNYSDHYGSTALLYACENACEEVVKVLIASGADVHHSDNQGRTSLVLATINGSTDVVQLLIDSGADVNDALIKAVCYGRLEIVQKVIAAGADVNKADSMGFTPLYYASQNGHEGIVEELISSDAGVDLAADERGLTPLYTASIKAHEKIVERLLAAGADVEKATKEGATPLYIASYHGHAEVVAQLIAAGANVNVAKFDKITPLRIASHHGHVGVVEKLIDVGADISVLSESKKNIALLSSSGTGNVGVVEKLIAAGADVDMVGYGIYTPLIHAAEYGHTEIVEQLIKSGADIDKVNCKGDTALMTAAKYGHVGVVEKLIAAGADVNLARNNGFTPLYVASMNGHTQIVQQLVENGAEK
eukprot:GSMAST32.ASY1.ANO1.2358.1 assembled CDS